MIRDRHLEGERPLYGIKDAEIINCTFGEGESPLKECRNIIVEGGTFGWKYPLWYCRDVNVRGTKWEEMARAGVWYSENVEVGRCRIEAPKNFRRCRNVTVRDTEFTNAAETFWNCDGLRLGNVKIYKGDYLAMNSTDVKAEGLDLEGNYAFDGGCGIEVNNSRLITKDAFWNCSNVTVRDSYISGEYLGWNSGDLTFINCTISSSQGLCYISNLRLINCRLVNTTLAFEYSSVEADIDFGIDSVFNPKSGFIKCGEIGELIIEEDKVDRSKTIIKAASINKISSRPEWL